MYFLLISIYYINHINILILHYYIILFYSYILVVRLSTLHQYSLHKIESSIRFNRLRTKFFLQKRKMKCVPK